MPEPFTVSVVIVVVVKKVFETLAGKVTEELWTKLQGDPAHKAFEKALAAAIQSYSTTGNRLDIARPLLDKDSFLTQPEVAAELAQVIRFDREPNAELIGRHWKEAIDRPPAWYDFTFEAQLLLRDLKNELRATDVFRPVFEAKTLDAIAANIAVSATALADLEVQLTSLYALMNARFADLIRAFAGASFNIRDQIRDESRFINEKTRDFVGRRFVFDAIDEFMQNNPRGYFIVRGDPGIGKSTLSAQLVKTHGYVHHFNIRATGIYRTDIFLKNICAQLIAAYNLKYDALPQEATQDAGFLNKLLGEVSDGLAGQKAVIVVDALDEVDTTGMPVAVNPLFLPVTLPAGIYVVLTARRETLEQRQEPVNLRIDCEQQTLYIDQDSQDNTNDIREFVRQAASRPGLLAYIKTQDIKDEEFVDHLVKKSQGNFMYLRYVLPEIERGAYKVLDLDALPVGLKNYYEDHWKRMKGVDREAWLKYKLPVVMALTALREPVSMDLLEDFSTIHDRARIYDVLEDWAQFLIVEQTPYEGRIQKRYRVYHSSFHDFIVALEHKGEEGVSLKEAHKKIAAKMMEDLFGNQQTQAASEKTIT